MSDMMTSDECSMRIKEYRKAKGMTQAELAEQMGVGRTTVTMWESGGSLPYAGQLPKLARVLNCKIDELFVAQNGGT